MRTVGGLLLVVLAVLTGVLAWAARTAPPGIEILAPVRVVGQEGVVEAAITTPRGALATLEITIEQDGRHTTLATLDEGATLTQQAENRVLVARPLGGRSVPMLREGPARLTVRASRSVLFGLRHREAEASRDLIVRLAPPRVAVVSTHHHVNHGGSEFVVYRAFPPEASSGVRVGDREYPGFPASAAGIETSDPALRAAFFALAWDQDLATPIQIFARDEAGNETTVTLDTKVFPKPFRRSRIELADAFLQRVVPHILQHTPTLHVDDPGDLLGAFLVINRQLREENNAAVRQMATRTGPRRLWAGPFRQLGSSKVEASFADQRTYVYRGEEVDRQVHLGFDLAVTARVPVRPANDGTVVFAGWLGIYGNTVIVDHGLGVQSLYAHLSEVDVEEGARVTAETVLGRSGMTGLAGGDHLHFTMLVHGEPVTPVDWWSRQWIEDRVLRKVREAASTQSS